MVYQVIARKCRPQTFEEVVGQEHVTRTLKNALDSGRIAHAFLFTGERGIGKTSVARILAKALNCRGGVTPQPCGTCVSCSEIAGGTSLDVHEIDGASNTGVDDIRALRESVKYLPSRDRYKVYIIDEVHMLSTSAFNALLKTLEEPPPHIVFIFATTEPHKIPDTIISRCLRFDFKRIPVKDIAAQLEAIARTEHVRISPRGLFLIAREAEGSMRDAQTMLERAISFCSGEVADETLEELLGYVDRGVSFRIMDALAAEDARSCLMAFHEAYSLGLDLKRFYYSFLEFLRDAVLMKTLEDVSGLLDLADEDMKRLTACVRRVAPEHLQQWFRLWFAAEAEMVRSVFPKIALEMCLLDLLAIKRTIPPEEILSRIESLQSRLEGCREIPSERSAGSQGRDAGRGKRPAAVPADSRSPEKPGADSRDSVQALLAFVRTKHLPTAAVLEHGAITISNGTHIRIEFPDGSFHIDKIKEPETEAKLRQIIAEFFHKDMNVSVVAARPPKKAPDTAHTIKAARQQEVLHNPIIQKIIKTFDGEIVTIKTDR